tara:strand:+ start:472 stop:714 length:243 start_codon:yes stop_codon:yes gene_type:complete
METKVSDQSRAGVSAQTITTTTDLANLTRAIYVGTAGNLPVTFDDNTTVTIEDAANGYHPLQVKSIGGTGLTASGVVAIF